MTKVKLLTDSGCDISKADELRYDIDIMSFEIVLGNEIFNERIDITNEEFYEKIDKSEFLPKTSQITIMRFEEKFLQYVEDEIEEVICVLINSTGSKTYENALLAEKQLRESGQLKNTKIHIIDSHSYSLGYGYPLIESAKKLEAGQSVNSVIAYLEDWFNCLEVYIIGFNLRHMKKSGRINAAAAFLGEMLSLKPVISLIDGKSAVVKKSRGEKAAVIDAVNYISSRAVPETPWQLLRTTVPELEDSFIKNYTKKIGIENSLVSYCGCVVAANAGPKFIGVLIKGQPRR